MSALPTPRPLRLASADPIPKHSDAFNRDGRHVWRKISRAPRAFDLAPRPQLAVARMTRRPLAPRTQVAPSERQHSSADSPMTSGAVARNSKWRRPPIFSGRQHDQPLRQKRAVNHKACHAHGSAAEALIIVNAVRVEGQRGVAHEHGLGVADRNRDIFVGRGGGRPTGAALFGRAIDQILPVGHGQASRPG